jgi:hypothetical protein
MYVVVSYGGEWDEKWENNEVCSHDEAKLNAWIAEQQKKRAEHQAFLISLHNFYYEFSANNPRRPLLMERKERKPWPSGLGKEQITPEMRAEREAIEAHNHAVFDEAKAIENEWREDTWFPALREWLKAQGKAVPETIDFSWSMGKNYFDDVNYRIEELKEI